MKKNKDYDFFESLLTNTTTYQQYCDRLLSLAISSFNWKNVPDTIDVRFMELCAITEGATVFFKDEVLGYLCLKVMLGGRLNQYGNPITFTAYGNNNYKNQLDESNGVIIYNNMLKSPSINDINLYAARLTNIERTIDVNVNAQKTPLFICCDENERLTLKNVFMKFMGNMPVIFGRKSMSGTQMSVLKTDAPYLSDKLYQLKIDTWNEALTYLGIPSISVNKKERLIKDEVQRLSGGALASRRSRLLMRQTACEQINKMFGLNMWVEYADDAEAEEEGVEINEPIYNGS